MALTAEGERLLAFARDALPQWYRAVDEFLSGAAKSFEQVRTLTTYLLEQTLITTAVGPTSTTPDWLLQHARDRGTVRQLDESDDALRVRLRTFAEALTRDAILAAANAILEADGISTPAQLLELPRDAAHFGVYTAPSGTGGTFAQSGTTSKFTPTVLPPVPPYRDPSVFPFLQWRLSISGADDAGNDSGVAATVDTADLTGDAVGLATDSTIWTATLTWNIAGLSGNGKTLDVRTDAGSGTVEVRDNERVTGGGVWVSAPGTVGIWVKPDIGLPVTIGDIETEIASASSLVTVTTPDASPSKEVDIGVMDATSIAANFAGGTDTPFVITGLDGNAIVYTNPSGVAGADTGVLWAAQRYDVDGNLRDGFSRAYIGRGYRMTRVRPMLVLILPYPTTIETERSVLAAVRPLLAAGFLLVVERRLIA